MNYDKCEELLKNYHQEHLLDYYDELTEIEKNNLLEEIYKIDFEYMDSLYRNKDNFQIENKEISSFKAIDKEKINIEKYVGIGIEHIKNGELAVCSMAGGQGTRLGYNGPKGTYTLPLDKPTSIFEILVNKLKDAYKKYGVYLYWYIMTSNQNHKQTINFFNDNNFFDYDKNHILFFEQGELPLLDEDGKIVLKDKSHIFMAPDGNGGIFKALGDKNIISHMQENGVRYLAVGNVDNILINMADPIALGLMIERDSELLAKSFMKPSPEGKWGVFCNINGKLNVIEYIETPKELIEARNESGELIFGDAHFGCNYFTTDFLQRIVFEKLPMHAALKKNSVLKGNEIQTEINTYKFEAFIFDSFGKANRCTVFRVKKDDEFAPIKNKEGDESPDTALQLYKYFYNIK